MHRVLVRQLVHDHVADAALTFGQLERQSFIQRCQQSIRHRIAGYRRLLAIQLTAHRQHRLQREGLLPANTELPRLRLLDGVRPMHAAVCVSHSQEAMSLTYVGRNRVRLGVPIDLIDSNSDRFADRPRRQRPSCRIHGNDLVGIRRCGFGIEIISVEHVTFGMCELRISSEVRHLAGKQSDGPSLDLAPKRAAEERQAQVRVAISHDDFGERPAAVPHRSGVNGGDPCQHRYMVAVAQAPQIREVPTTAIPARQVKQ